MPLRIAGRSAWLDAGRPVRAVKSLSLRDDSGIVGYVPGDLTLTVRAGTPLSEIARATQEHEQWLPLDPYGSSDGTIGATIATGSAGPLASSFGLPRDLLLGLEFVNGRGDVVRAGGKVVKNVAGFDLPKLMVGSLGTLGVIVQVALKVRPLPKATRTLVTEQGGVEVGGRLVAFRGEEAFARSPSRVRTAVCALKGLSVRSNCRQGAASHKPTAAPSSSASFSLKVVATETLSNTASTATRARVPSGRSTPRTRATPSAGPSPRSWIEPTTEPSG